MTKKDQLFWELDFIWIGAVCSAWVFENAVKSDFPVMSSPLMQASFSVQFTVQPNSRKNKISSIGPLYTCTHKHTCAHAHTCAHMHTYILTWIALLGSTKIHNWLSKI